MMDSFAFRSSGWIRENREGHLNPVVLMSFKESIMQNLLITTSTAVSHEVIILVATVAVCFIVAYLLSLSDGRHFGK